MRGAGWAECQCTHLLPCVHGHACIGQDRHSKQGTHASEEK